MLSLYFINLANIFILYNGVFLLYFDFRVSAFFSVVYSALGMDLQYLCKILLQLQ